MNTYIGKRSPAGRAVVTKNTELLSGRHASRIRWYSPAAFEWGDGSSGPFQLALALLLEETSEQEARVYYRAFRREVIALLPRTGTWVMDSHCIQTWLQKKRAASSESPLGLSPAEDVAGANHAQPRAPATSQKSSVGGGCLDDPGT